MQQTYLKNFSYTVLFALLFILILALGLLVWAWAPDRSVAQLTAKWAPAPSQFIQLQGMNVHFRDEGPKSDPHPIVLLHGTSASLHTWDGWAAALSGQRRVIRMDLPAFGLTGPHPSGRYRVTDYVAFVNDLLDALHVKQAVMAGNSLGGEIAWMMALAHPEKISRLILIDAAGYPMLNSSMPIGFKIAQYAALKPLVANVLPWQMIESSVKSVYGQPDRITPGLIDRYYELTLREGNRAALFDRFTDSSRGSNAPNIRKITQPTLIIWGMQDRLIPPENAERFHQDIKGSQVLRFEDLGHVPQEEDPARTLAAIQSFVNNLASNQ